MKRQGLLVLALVISLFTSSLAQTVSPAPQETTKPAEDNYVVRISTDLIQIDAVVTDKSGKFVSNLRPEDFEIVVNGKSQPITNFAFITSEPRATEQPAVVVKNAKGDSPPMPPVRLRPEQIKRTIALVVDDLGLSFESISHVRAALKKFVDEQMQAGDLVSIVRVGRGIGALQQFTSDKQQLYAAIAAVKYDPNVGRIMSFNPEDEGGDSSLPNTSMTKGTTTQSSGDPSPDRSIKKGTNADDFRREVLANASLSATRFVVQGMRGLPGRKAVLFLSDGFALHRKDEPEYSILIRKAIERLVDSAQRSGVVIYTMDARGVEDRHLTAADTVGIAMTSRQISAGMAANMKAFLAPQDGLIYLAKQAGGIPIYNTNDIGLGIRIALDDQKSYYLLGYRPDPSLFGEARNRFNQLTVKVKSPGLNVRYRSGFFGIGDEEVWTVAGTPEQQIMRALTSPFAAGDINLRFTPLFTNSAKTSLVRSLVHISARDLTFADKPNGMHEAVINIVAYTFGDNGAVVDSVGETHTITLTDKLYERALSSGLVYSLNVPVRNAGAHQLRVAVRDDKSQKVGSASQFLNIPDISKGRLSLSGIALSSFDPKENKDRAMQHSEQSTDEAPGSALTQAALRRFRAGHTLRFAYAIYNARLDTRSKQPQLATQLRLYRDGKEVYAGKETPYEPGGQIDLSRLIAEGGLQLGGLQAGEYVLQIEVTDALAKGKHRTTTGWIDFEIEK